MASALALIVEKPTLESFAQNGMRPQRMTVNSPFCGVPARSDDGLHALGGDVEGRSKVGLVEDIVIVSLHPFRNPLFIGPPSVPTTHYLPFFCAAQRFR
jgi:hypothetical protein